ncbi:MAG: hypothetical protein QOE58_998 [Actinomycetota bacterium]|nr:hypothetical protein [Actinomycetota bacterium]
MAVKMGSFLMESVPRLRFEQTSQRIRVLHGSTTLADTTSAVLVWEPRRVVPGYAVPDSDLDAKLVPSRAPIHALDELPVVVGPENFSLHTSPGQGLDVHVGDEVLPDAAFRPDDPDLAGYVSLEFGAFTWLEEDEEAVGHPHDPFKRIDTLHSSRHVVVALDGTVLADTTRAVALLETNLPTRWYIPQEDVRMELLEPSSHRTTCAYKGHASYYSVVGAGDAGRDIAWTYPEPLHDGERVRDLVCFFSERTDLSVDGVELDRPVTPWSSPD